MCSSSIFEKQPTEELKRATGDLHQYIINKNLAEGLLDKSLQDYEYFTSDPTTCTTIESDCSICFSPDSSHNNPIIYCSDSK